MYKSYFQASVNKLTTATLARLTDLIVVQNHLSATNDESAAGADPHWGHHANRYISANALPAALCIDDPYSNTLLRNAQKYLSVESTVLLAVGTLAKQNYIPRNRTTVCYIVRFTFVGECKGLNVVM